MQLYTNQLKSIVEKSIDELSLKIMKEPSSFYVERDTHGYLYTLLLKNGIPLHAIHLEYPSIEVRKGKHRKTRPKYDFSIYNLPQNKVWKINNFKEEDEDPIIPKIVIELGVDTEAWHQEDDINKIIKGNVKNGYVLNFIRWFNPFKYKNCKSFESDLESFTKQESNINLIRFVHGPIKIENDESSIDYDEEISHWRIIDGKKDKISKKRYCVAKEQYYSDNEGVECPICGKIEY